MNENYQEQIKEFSDEKLCDIIISFRYLGMFKEESISCMIELANRRASGSAFEYEKYIDENLLNLPKFKMDISKVIKAPKWK